MKLLRAFKTWAFSSTSLAAGGVFWDRGYEIREDRIVMVLAQCMNEFVMRFSNRVHWESSSCLLRGLRKLFLLQLCVELADLGRGILILDHLAHYLRAIEAKLLHWVNNFFIKVIRRFHWFLRLLLRFIYPSLFDYHSSWVLRCLLLSRWSWLLRSRIHDDIVYDVEIVIDQTSCAMEGSSSTSCWRTKHLRSQVSRWLLSRI